MPEVYSAQNVTAGRQFRVWKQTNISRFSRRLIFVIQVWKVAAGLVHSACLDGDFFDQDSLVKILNAYSMPLDLKIAQDRLQLV